MTRWRRIGKIFDPRDHALPLGCISHAQSPQALVFDDFVRIYFTTRAVDPSSGKFLSHVAYVDMHKNLREVIGVSSHEVLPLGGLGTFDEHGIFPISPLKHEGKVMAYTCGWSRRRSVSVETGIGLVTSEDGGRSFTRHGAGPVLGASLHEPCLVGDAFVRFINGQFHMWYIFGTGWQRFADGAEPDRTYKIGHAVSSNGIDWVKDEAQQIIPDRLGETESQALPSVIAINGRYHMVFCYRESFDFRHGKGRGYRLGHAYSDDLTHWTRDDDWIALRTGEEQWDSDMQCYPHLFACEGKIYLLYNGNHFGREGFGLAVLDHA